jgi:ATP-dependent exoDNAse (exonuclease V) beta subunit
VITAFKKQNNHIHISEFNRRISSVVLREPVPFIYERLGERYHHLMIDEFQDTSRLQWQNFIPLIENALASGYFNLVVGDGKQAIYRWRNGDVNQFTSLPLLEGSDTNPLIRQRQQVLLHHFREESLNRNYRSRAEIVGFNNRFFRYLAGMLDENGQAVYKGLEQEVDPGNTGGFVRISFLSGEEENYSFSEHNYSEIIQTIREVTEDGYAPGDIAILCRKNLQASRIARVLTAAGIDVVSSESLLLAQSAEVGFLISFIRFLFLEENPVNRAEVAGYLFQTGRLPGLSWPEVLRRIAPAGRSDHGLMNLLKEHGFDIPKDDLMALPLYDLCETLIRIFGLNRRVDPYVQFFLDAVMVFMDRDLHGAPDFSDWWEEQKNELSIVVPDGLHAVRIMTIHKSKGLQFPVVIFPFATETKRIARDHLWVDLHDQQIPDFPVSLLKTETAMEKTVFAAQYREEDQKSMLDLVNLLYVVMTRPEERLFILTQAPPEKSETRSSLPAFFSGFLQGEQNWEPGQPLFECGIRRPANRTRAETVESQLKLSSFISEDWRKKIRIKRRAPEMWNMEDPLGKVQFGNLVHTLLSAIHFRGDLDKVLRDASASGLFPADDHAAVRRMIQGVLDHPELATFYREGATVKTEPEILLPDGNSFRPDRVVLEKDHPVVIEYKTGKKDDRHARQLDQYETVLHDMGYENVHKYLVYLHDPPEVIVWKS